MQIAKDKRRSALRMVAAVTAATLLIAAFRDVDFARVQALLSKVAAPAFLLVLLPQICSLTSECIGWRAVFSEFGYRVALTKLLQVRVATEALAQTLPMGVIWAESIKPMLLSQHCGVPLSDGIAAIAVRKYLLMFSQGIYVAGTALLGFAMLHTVSTQVLSVPGLEWLVLSAGVLVTALALLLRALFMQAALAGRVLALLKRIPNARFRTFLCQSTRGFMRTDERAASYFRRGVLPNSAIWFLIGWLFETLETYLILRLLGIELDFTTVGAMEVALSFVRNVVFFLPAGLFVQDLGYLTFLRGFGVHEAVSVGAAFLLLKRGKEAFWAAVGYGLLITDSPTALATRRSGLTFTPDKALRV